MTTVRLLRRLNDLGVARVIENMEQRDQGGSKNATMDTDDPTFVWYAPSGGSAGTRLDEQIAAEIRVIASTHGFPEPSNQAAKSAFDTEVAQYLGSLSELQAGEALRDDVWAFLSAVLLQDVVEWRFPDMNVDRLKGGVRNAFQRLWVRGITLDLGETHPSRWNLVEALSEDAMVQIFERASIGSNAKLARAIATAWIKTADEIGHGKMEAVMRQATKFIRIRNEIIDLTFLESSELERAVQDAFFQVADLELTE